MSRRWNRRVNLRPEPVRLAQRKNWSAYALRQFHRGLTTRGTIPKRRLDRLTISCRAKPKAALAAMDRLASALAKCFHQLSPAAQGAALELENQLAGLRRQLEQ